MIIIRGRVRELGRDQLSLYQLLSSPMSISQKCPRANYLHRCAWQLRTYVHGAVIRGTIPTLTSLGALGESCY